MTAKANTQFTRPDGKECPAYYSAPAAGDAAPGVVVIQEWWGLNDQIVGAAERLVESGHRVLVPDLYRGDVTLEAAEAAHKMENLDFPDAAAQDARGAVQHLKQTSPKVGVVGFCMGGVVALMTAMYAPEVDAAVSWYGVPPEEAGDPSRIAIPVQGHFAMRDSFFSPDKVDALEQKLKSGGVSHEFFRYDAEHAFGNETGPHYDAEAAKLAWERTLAFFAQQLRA
ncbi:MAG: dienelactone hydrolase family protein [Gammaproteobacteria bacterium]